MYTEHFIPNIINKPTGYLETILNGLHRWKPFSPAELDHLNSKLSSLNVDKLSLPFTPELSNELSHNEKAEALRQVGDFLNNETLGAEFTPAYTATHNYAKLLEAQHLNLRATVANNLQWLTYRNLPSGMSDYMKERSTIALLYALLENLNGHIYLLNAPPLKEQVKGVSEKDRLELIMTVTIILTQKNEHNDVIKSELETILKKMITQKLASEATLDRLDDLLKEVKPEEETDIILWNRYAQIINLMEELELPIHPAMRIPYPGIERIDRAA